MTVNPTNETEISSASDQELVDLYLGIVAILEDTGTGMDDEGVQQAAVAAYTLEMRGYIEQSGTWTHNMRPDLSATA